MINLAQLNCQPSNRYKVLRFTPTEGQLKLLKNFSNRPGFDFWNEPRKLGGNLDIMVSPEQQPVFLAYLKLHGIRFNILNENVQT
jgi:hypothetical protein